MRGLLAAILFLATISTAFAQGFQKGTKVEAKWGEFWKEGTIVEVKGSQYKVHFDGYGSVYDDWFTVSQLKSRENKNSDKKTAQPQNAGQVLVAGSRVEIEYAGRWYPGYVMEVKEDKYKIHYEGYGDNWDSWVTKDKLRPLNGDGGVEITNKNSPAEDKQAKAAQNATIACSFEPPAPKYVNTDAFSVSLAKRNLYDKYSQRVNGTTSAPTKLGVSFLSFQALTPYKNTVTVDPGRGAERRNGAAPANIMIYPVKSKHIVCEQYPTGTTRYQVEGEYDCFKNKDGEWVCGSSGTVPPKITQLDR